MILRRAARPMLAAIFISGGVEALRSPQAHARAAKPVLEAVGPAVDQAVEVAPVDERPDDEMLVKIDAGVKIVAGTMLAFGKFPRLASTALAASLIPTTLAGHRFWEEDDPEVRAQQQIHFLKNLGLLGGLLIASADTHGKPSLGWRARKAAAQLSGPTSTLGDSAAELTEKLAGVASDVSAKVGGATQEVGGRVGELAQEVSTRAADVSGRVGVVAQDVGGRLGERVGEVAQDVGGRVGSRVGDASTAVSGVAAGLVGLAPGAGAALSAQASERSKDWAKRAAKTRRKAEKRAAKLRKVAEKRGLELQKQAARRGVELQ